MTIRFKKDRIEFENGANSFILFEESSGFAFTGRIAGTAIEDAFQGSVAGFATSGRIIPTYTDTSDTFPFATDSNSVLHANLGISGARNAAGHSSTTNGYISGGYTPPVVAFKYRFPFATGASATYVNNLATGKYAVASQSSPTYGYVSGGVNSAFGVINAIEKFLFQVGGEGTSYSVGNLTTSRYNVAGQSSTVSGYTNGGSPPSNMNTIDKFPFATDANATDVGDLTVNRSMSSGQSSTVSGYTSGGGVSNIDKFPFATDANATNVGTLTTGSSGSSGQSSTVSGYNSGGPFSNIIEKFPFATNANATDVGDLTTNKYGSVGQQY